MMLWALNVVVILYKINSWRSRIRSFMAYIVIKAKLPRSSRLVSFERLGFTSTEGPVIGHQEAHSKSKSLMSDRARFANMSKNLLPHVK